MRNTIKERSIQPNAKFKDAIETFDTFYRDTVGIKYHYSAKDFANLKFLLRKLEGTETELNTFLRQITSKWHLGNLSIPLLNSHFQQLYAQQAAEQTSKHPDKYDKYYLSKLQPEDIPSYYQHLRKLGYIPTYSPGGGSSWKLK